MPHRIVVIKHCKLTKNGWQPAPMNLTPYLLLLLLITRPFPKDGSMAEDHGAPKAGQLSRAWTRGREKTESRQRVSGVESVAGQCRMRWEVSWDQCAQALQEGFSILPILNKNLKQGCVRCSEDEKEHIERDEGAQVSRWKSREPACQKIWMRQYASSLRKVDTRETTRGCGGRK